MAQGSIVIRTKPSAADELSTREIAAELQAAEERIHKGELKFRSGFGFRKIGDPLIYFGHDSKQWTYPQDIELQVDCRAMEGQCISSADIKVDQGSSLKTAEIIEGGIGQQYIRILVKAQNTYWLRYEVRLYGSYLPMRMKVNSGAASSFKYYLP